MAIDQYIIHHHSPSYNLPNNLYNRWYLSLTTCSFPWWQHPMDGYSPSEPSLCGAWAWRWKDRMIPWNSMGFSQLHYGNWSITRMYLFYMLYLLVLFTRNSRPLGIDHWTASFLWKNERRQLLFPCVSATCYQFHQEIHHLLGTLQRKHRGVFLFLKESGFLSGF